MVPGLAVHVVLVQQKQHKKNEINPHHQVDEVTREEGKVRVEHGRDAEIVDGTVLGECRAEADVDEGGSDEHREEEREDAARGVLSLGESMVHLFFRGENLFFVCLVAYCCFFLFVCVFRRNSNFEGFLTVFRSSIELVETSKYFFPIAISDR